MDRKRFTLCLLIRGGTEVLLARKTRKIGIGRYNGYGGKQEEGETLEECALRETAKESGLTINPDSMTKYGVLTISNYTIEAQLIFIAEIHCYIVTEWSGTLVSTEEMIDPEWFPIHHLPYAEMMPADSTFFTPMINGKKIIGEAYYMPQINDLMSQPNYRCVEKFEPE